jgi:GAF domain-containing protein
VDDRHVALSYQFFNKTRQNILANPRATVEVIDPGTAAHYHLYLEYRHTETEGPLFEYMKARLAAIASHTGMSRIFKLLGSDVYRVLRIDAMPGGLGTASTESSDLLSGLRACLAGLNGSADLAALLDGVLEGLERHCDIRHGMVLMLDPQRECLYTVVSRGYPESGVGSEIRLGEGIIGVAARERCAIRIGYAVQDYRYVQATRQRFAERGVDAELDREIPVPGLPTANSQLAVPMLYEQRLLGVIYVESPQEQRFSYEEEDALSILAGQLAMGIELLARNSEQAAEPLREAVAVAPPAAATALPAEVRHFAADRSVFVDNEYLIKGVAGAILWKLLRENVDSGRCEFTNRELRLDASLGLPDITDNLDARLILLQRRLVERCSFMAIEKTGRGRFRLRVQRPLRLAAVARP